MLCFATSATTRSLPNTNNHSTQCPYTSCFTEFSQPPGTDAKGDKETRGREGKSRSREPNLTPGQAHTDLGWRPSRRGAACRRPGRAASSSPCYRARRRWGRGRPARKPGSSSEETARCCLRRRSVLLYPRFSSRVAPTLHTPADRNRLQRSIPSFSRTVRERGVGERERERSVNTINARTHAHAREL